MTIAAQENLRLQKWITTISIILFLAKIAAYYITHSLAVLSDALESIVNVMAGFAGLYSLHIAAKPKDADHPYGHGKAEFVAAAFEGGLIIASGVLILYESVINLIKQKPLTQLDSGIIIIAVTAIINFIAGWMSTQKGIHNNSAALQATGKHLQTDTITTLAIIVALILVRYTGIQEIDLAVALALCVIIFRNGYLIVRSSLAGIMDEADMKILRQMIDVLYKNRNTNWVDLHNLRVIKYGAVLHIDCHLTVPWYLNVHEAHAEIDCLQDLVKKTFGESIEMFVHTDGCLPFSCRICQKADCLERQHSFVKEITWNTETVLSNKKHQL